MTNTLKLLAAFFVGLIVPAGVAVPAQPLPAAMATGGLTSQPIGHYEFCQALPAECAVKSKARPAPRLSAAGWAMVERINRAVNARYIARTDMEIFGREEVWAYPDYFADCEDYVLQKRRELMAAGFSPADLLITVVRKPDGEGHAVLTLRTAEGDFILDNLDDGIRSWHDTPYAFLKRQASTHSGRWVTIENGSRDLLVGALR